MRFLLGSGTHPQVTSGHKLGFCVPKELILIIENVVFVASSVLPYDIFSLHNNGSHNNYGNTYGSSHLPWDLQHERVSSKTLDPIEPLLSVSTAVHGVHRQGAAQGSDKGRSAHTLPIFDDSAPRNVTGLQGNAVYLHCIVTNLNNKSVSWIRQRDLKILTVGLYTYTTDQRFEVLHSEENEDWMLKIKYAQKRDSGKYDCQVSTRPPTYYTVQLNINVPRTIIEGGPDLHVDKGSSVHLSCTVVHSPQPRSQIQWFHNNKLLEYGTISSDISITVEDEDDGEEPYSLLEIRRARSYHSGNYTCAAVNTQPSFVSVHVLNGETPAAMQTSRSSCSFSPHVLTLTFITVFLTIITSRHLS
ncbi:zwei Ig domain protein zig-8-like [Oratosquilla oratoria]|uniref:zwei Ig domain protein zig-8-like n=1 Tax=Oratosquilla oratoria TaxID=337810 RepID=UPI003F776A80